MTETGFSRLRFSVAASAQRERIAIAHPGTVHPDDLETLEAFLAHANVPGAHSIVRVRLTPGSWRLGEHRVVANDDGVLSIDVLDVTDRERDLDLEARAEAYWRAVLRNSHESIVVVDPVSLRITFASDQLGALLDRDPAGLVGSRAAAHVDRRDVSTVRSLFAPWAPNEPARTAELRLRRRDGGTAWTEAVVSDARDDEAVGAYIVNIRDIEDRKHAEEQLRASEHLFRVLVQHVGDGAVVVGEDGAMNYVTERAAASLGATVGELVGRAFELRETPEGFLVGHAPVDRAAGSRPRLPLEAMAPDGRWFRVVGHDLTDDPIVRATVYVLRDITDGRTRVERLRRQVEQDPLTGVLNRRGLIKRLESLLETGRSVAIGFLDLDGFKKVNDTHGHAAGDAVLRAVAARLSRSLRPGDEVARLGGDEFVVVLMDAPQDAELIELADRVVGTLVGTYTTDAGTVEIGVSAGWSVAGAGSSAEDALHRADRRMYEQKRRTKA